MRLAMSPLASTLIREITVSVAGAARASAIDGSWSL
jgi:hypothetical protein